MVGLYVEHWNLFHLSFDVSAFSIINLLVISLLGWLATFTIQNALRRTKSQQDLYYNKIDELDINLKRLYGLVLQQEGTSYTEVCAIDKINRRWYKFVSKSIDKTYSNLCDKTCGSDVNDGLKALRNSTTSIAIAPNGEPDCVVEKGIIRYSDGRKQEIESEIDDVRYKLFLLKEALARI